VINRAHPLSAHLGEVVVGGNQVDTSAGEGVQVERERGHQGLALAGLHLRDLALVEHDAADDLDVKVAQADGACGGLAHGGERLGEDLT